MGWSCWWRSSRKFTQGAADRFRRTAAHLGVEIAAYSLENDFAHHRTEVRHAEVQTVCHWIRSPGLRAFPS